MFNLPNKPQSITEVIATGYALYRSLFQAIIYLMAAIAVVVTIGHYLTAPSVASAGIASQFNIMHLLVSLIMFLITAVLYVAAFVFADAHVKGLKISINDAIQHALNKAVPILLASLLIYVAVTIGMFILVIPGIFIAILTVVYLPAIALENREAIDAIKYSCELVWGNWWHTFAILFLASIVPGIISVLVLFVLVLIHGSLLYLGMVVLYAVISPFLLSVLLVVFRDLQLRHSQKPIVQAGA